MMIMAEKRIIIFDYDEVWSSAALEFIRNEPHWRLLLERVLARPAKSRGFLANEVKSIKN